MSVVLNMMEMEGQVWNAAANQHGSEVSQKLQALARCHRVGKLDPTGWDRIFSLKLQKLLEYILDNITAHMNAFD